MDRRNFLRAAGAVTVATVAGSALDTAAKAPSASATPAEKGIRIRFLGTGAADWNGPDDRGEYRRRSSVLVDGRILIDYTQQARDMLPRGCVPEAVFYTHSHRDHYNPEALLRLGVPKVYLGKSWISRAWQDFAKASADTGLPVPEIVPLATGETIVLDGIAITALPANHATADLDEEALIYLVEKGPVRLLYATDTGGIMARAARIADFEPHKGKTPLTAIIMEATMGMGEKGDEDFRIFTHSSVNTVLRTARMLSSRKLYCPPEGQAVYLTHLARTLHPTQAELDATLPAPLKAAFDGLEVLFRS